MSDSDVRGDKGKVDLLVVVGIEGKSVSGSGNVADHGNSPDTTVQNVTVRCDELSRRYRS